MPSGQRPRSTAPVWDGWGAEYSGATAGGTCTNANDGAARMTFLFPGHRRAALLELRGAGTGTGVPFGSACAADSASKPRQFIFNKQSLRLVRAKSISRHNSKLNLARGLDRKSARAKSGHFGYSSERRLLAADGLCRGAPCCFLVAIVIQQVGFSLKRTRHRH